MEDKKRILIVEDDAKISKIIDLQLKHSGYYTEVASDGLLGIKRLRQQEFDLVLMDVMMPNMNGFEALKIIKTEFPHVKVIMLSAKDEITDVIEGLDLGADDYVAKPFIFEELLARIRANIRKPGIVEVGDAIVFEDLTVNEKTFEVFRAGEPIDLSNTEFNLLLYLLQNKTIVLSRDQILSRVWGDADYRSPNVVDVYIKYLRDKVDRNFERKIIHTIRGRGYVLK